MNTDKKQIIGADSSSSNSSLPLFSPLVDKNQAKSLDFSAAAIGFQSCELLDSDSLEHTFHSLHLVTNQSLTCKQGHEEDLPALHLGEEKRSSLAISLECTPVLEKEKVSLGEEVFEVPELTAESMISSEDIDLDSESNPNDLPLCSTRRHNIDRVFQEQSEGSDEYEDRSKAYLAKQNYAESKGSDRSESDDFPSICKLCYTLVEKSKVLEVENAELARESQTAKEQLVKVQEKNKRLLEQREEQLHPETLPPLLLKEHFLAQIQDISKTLPKVNEFLASYAFDFRGKECEPLQRFSLEFKKLEDETLGRVERESKRRDLQQLHNGYKKMISKLIKDFEEREAKKDVDFRRFVTAVARRPPPEPPRPFDGKGERSRRKSKTYAEKEDNTEMELIQNSRQWEQSRQRVQWLQMALIREKESWQQQERNYLERHHRLQAQIVDLTHERNTYRSLAGKYSQEFADFMFRLAQQQSSSLTQSDFFRTLSQRVFEISNCIPFEDNDEQNLFAPESEDQLFEMLDRVRRFYRRIEDYNLQRDSEFEAEKSSFMRFLKELVELNKVPPRLLLETLEGNSYAALGYLRELIRSSRLPEKEQVVPGRESIGNRMLKIERAKSFTISSHGFQDHN